MLFLLEAKGAMKEPILEGLLTRLALIRRYLQACEDLATDDQTRAHLLTPIAAFRRDLVWKWRETAELTPVDLGMSAGTFKDTALNLMLVGLSQPDLRFYADTAFARITARSLFSDAEEAHERFVYEFVEPVDIFAAQALPADRLYALFAEDVLRSAGNVDNYASSDVFDRNVLMKFVALLYAIESSGGMFDRDDDGGQPRDAPVPRRPVPPQMSAEAAEEIPDSDDPDIDSLMGRLTMHYKAEAEPTPLK